MYKQLFGFPQYSPISIQDGKEIICFIYKIYGEDIRTYYSKTDIFDIITLVNPFNSAFNENKELQVCFYLNNIFNMYQSKKVFVPLEDGGVIASSIVDSCIYPDSFIYHRLTVAKFNTLTNLKYDKIPKYFLNLSSMMLGSSINFNCIKWLFGNEDYSSRNNTLENTILRRCIFPFYFLWDNLSIFGKHEMMKKIKMNTNKINHAQYYFYKICDSKMFKDIGDKMFVIVKNKNLTDILLKFKK